MSTEHRFEFSADDRQYTGTVRKLSNHYILSIDQIENFSFRVVDPDDLENIYMVLPSDRPGRKPEIKVSVTEAPFLEYAIRAALG